MKIWCTCGHMIPDISDSIAHKAHLMPDQSLFDYWDKLERLVLDLLDSLPDRAAIDELLTLLKTDPNSFAHKGWNDYARELRRMGTRQLWQCTQCGKLYVDAHGGELRAFTPVDAAASKDVLAEEPEL